MYSRQVIDDLIMERPMLEISTASLNGMHADLTRANREIERETIMLKDAIIGVNNRMLRDIEMEKILRN